MAGTPTATRANSKITKEMEDAVENRLRLNDGTTFKEIASDLVNRFGDKSLDNKAEVLLAKAFDIGRLPERKEEAGKLKKQGRELKAQAKTRRAEEVAKFGMAVEPFLMGKYGDKRTDEYGRPFAYGDRIEILKGMHVKLLY